MKKVLAIVLMLAMVLSVVGCQANGNNDVEPTQAPEASAVPATTEPTAAPVDSTEPTEAKGSSTSSPRPMRPGRRWLRNIPS